MTATTVSRLATTIAMVLVLSACPAISPNRPPPPSLDHAAQLAQRGDHAAAAREFEALAAENNVVDAPPLSLRAAREWLANASAVDAERVLLALPALTGPLATQRKLLGAELDLLKGAATRAWQVLNEIPAPNGSGDFAQQYFLLRQRVALATGRPLEAVRAEASAEQLAESDTARNTSRLQLLRALRDAAQQGIKIEPQQARDPTARGWLELAPIAAQAARRSPDTPGLFAAWRTRNPTHPAYEIARSEFGTALAASSDRPELGTLVRGPGGEPISGTGTHIALLLPMSGRAASAAAQIRDGFLTGYYSTTANARPDVRIYDTAAQSVADAIGQAARAGAVFIAGPLTRDEANAAADYNGSRPPMLTLNFLAPDHPTPADFYQFALSPEDEARAVARRVVQEGRLRGVALIPSGDWGVRVLAAFSEQLQKSGGQLLSSATLPAGRNDFQNAIQQVLRISDSRARHERLERVLGTSLEFQPRRRTDVDFIFAPGQAPIARQLKPQLKFYYAGDIPTYATSDAYEPSSTLNQDMEGLIFPDMPWMVSGSAAVTKLHGAVHDAWGDDTGGRGGRLFGFGYDAWSLAIALQSNRGSGAGWPLNGVTGELSLDEQHRVRREFDWAQIRSGSPRVLSRASDK